ncbi:MAG: flagellar hook-basal body complex protein [Synergistaceae bacterium]|nr:flagellar hook-basal body complex protein [Synergistaceae bacterium]
MPVTTGTPSLSTVSSINQGGFHASKVTIYDCQGKPYTLEVVFKKLTGNRWRWEASVPGEEKLFVSPSSGQLYFDDSCKIISPMDPVSIGIDFGMNATSYQEILLDFSGQSFGRDVMQGVTQFSGASTTKGFYQDGYAMGILSDFDVGQDGTIVGKYTNGQNQPIYRVALAQFANPAGLDQIGNTMFRETINSGLANINPAGEDGGGTIMGGNLEMSNVDLTEEFTRLIISQRGFQANTRVVSVSDSILEEVVNMKR